MNFRTILILGALTAFGPLAIDFYLPAFPSMALAFGTDEKHVQMTLAAYFAGLAASPQAIAEIRTKLGLDKSLPEQFVGYIGDLLHGNLGNSLSTGQPVVTEIATRLPASAELTPTTSQAWLSRVRRLSSRVSSESSISSTRGCTFCFDNNMTHGLRDTIGTRAAEAPGPSGAQVCAGDG